jgi:membrane fusion protein, heavy metal efflux system
VNSFPRLATALLTLSAAIAIGVAAWWIVVRQSSKSSGEKPAPAATVAKVVKEDDLQTVVLTEEAEKRLGLKTASVQFKDLRRVRVYGGEVAIPPGRTILVSAPLSGTLKLASPAAKTGPIPGQNVKAGQPLFHLLPLLTPDGRATLSASLTDAEGQVNNAKTQVDLAKIALDRAKRVLSEGAGSQRQVDEAQAAFDLATKTLEAVAARRAILAKVVGDVETGTAAPIPIDSPEDGLLRSVSVQPGQTVPSGAVLFEVIDLSTVWVRVALPVGDLEAVDGTVPARVGSLSAAPGTSQAIAKPVAGPPSANPLTSTVDFFYELPNLARKLTPGQRLGVAIPLTDSQETLSVPWSAIVFDVNGGTWVYEQIEPRKYVRRRVTVKYTLGDDAALSAGPAAGATVVAFGVQELFGAETGFIK